MTEPKPGISLNTLRALLAASFLLAALALFQFIQQAIAEEVFLVTPSRTAMTAAGTALCLILLTALIASYTAAHHRLLGGMANFRSSLERLPALVRWPLVGLTAVALPWIARSYYGRYLYNDFPRYLLLWLCALVLTALLQTHFKWSGWPLAFLLSVVGISFLYTLSAFIYDVSTYPLSLSWSEGSRYYFASTFAAQRVYGSLAPLPVTHPSRYLMQAVPFLLGDLPLWLHRLWQPLMTVGLTVWSAALLRKRFELSGGVQAWLFILWASLFLLQGPIFYQMMIMVVLLLWGIDFKRPGRTWVLILLTGFWAGISRINWVPMPAVIAATLYFMQHSPRGRGLRPMARYLAPTLIWFTTAMAAGLSSSALYAAVSGNPAELFTSSFTSDLLWYRLLPNPTYPPGILIGALLVSLPLLVALVLGLRSFGGTIHRLRLLCLGIILLVFFVGGLVVSVKIGGGTNLHNMDAFLLLLLIISTGAYAGRIESAPAIQPPAALLAVIVLLPALFATSSGGVLPARDTQAAQAVIDEIQRAADQAVTRELDVLFISQRQLLTFGTVDAPFFPHYEKLLLMEMAMARNDSYLSAFEADLRAQRFGVIISDPLFDRVKRDANESLAEENDAWVQRITRPILCAYEIDYTAEGVQILEPIPGGWQCD